MSLKDAELKVERAVENISVEDLLQIADKEPTGIGVYVKNLFAYEYNLIKEAEKIYEEAKRNGKYSKDENELKRKATILLQYAELIKRDSYLMIKDPKNLEEHKRNIGHDFEGVDRAYQEFVNLFPEDYRERAIKKQEELFKKHFPQGVIVATIGILLVGSLLFFRSFSPTTSPTGYITLGDFSSTYIVAIIIGIVLLGLFAFLFFKKRKK